MTTAGTYEIDVQDLEYLRHGDSPLLARMFKPRGDGPFPLVIELHGGAWCRDDRTSDSMINEPVARSGVVVASLDFRMPPVASYPACLEDINYAIRWFKTQAAALGSRPDRVGLMGTSSGAHLAMLSAMRPRDARYAAIPLAAGVPGAATMSVIEERHGLAGARRAPGGLGGPSRPPIPSVPAVDATVRAVVLCWPVIDPLGRYQYAKALKASGDPYPDVIDRVLPCHDQFWLTEEAMAEGAPARALERGERADLPPALYLQGTRDVAHPRADLDRFVAAYEKAGGEVELEMYDGEAEGFVKKSPSSPASQRAIARIIEFVHKRVG